MILNMLALVKIVKFFYFFFFLMVNKVVYNGSSTLTALFNCGPCDNFCYLGHTKNPDDDDDDDVSLTLTRRRVR